MQSKHDILENDLASIKFKKIKPERAIGYTREQHIHIGKKLVQNSGQEARTSKLSKKLWATLLKVGKSNKSKLYMK